MSRGTTHRTFRAEDEIWLPAKARAGDEGVNLSDILREALRAYAQGRWSPDAPPLETARRE